MSITLVFWLLPALLLFWAVGAHNRLVRLRAQAKAAFAALDTELAAQAALVQERLPALAEDLPPALKDLASLRYDGLRAAASQLEAALAGARPRPLEPQRIDALRTALEVLHAAWQRTGDDVAEWPTAEAAAAWEAAVLQVRRTAEAFDQLIAHYNRARSQFPALLLAWLFGFAPAGAVRAQA